MAEGQEFRVARDEDIRLGGDGSGENSEIVFVAESDLRRFSRLGQPAILAYQLEVISHEGARESELELQDPAKLIEDLLRHNGFMVRKDLSHDVSTQPTRRRRAGQNVRVQEYLHETSANTSSSVR